MSAIRDSDSHYTKSWRAGGTLCAREYQAVHEKRPIRSLAFSAFVVGENEESILLLNVLLHESTTKDIPVIAEARALLQKIDQEGDDTPGFLEWLWEQAKGLLP